jgi:hypothetical protein
MREMNNYFLSINDGQANQIKAISIDAVTHRQQCRRLLHLRSNVSYEICINNANNANSARLYKVSCSGKCFLFFLFFLFFFFFVLWTLENGQDLRYLRYLLLLVEILK